MEVGGGKREGRGAFGTKVEAGLQPAVSRRRVSYGFAIGYYEAAPSALQATCGFRNAPSCFGHYPERYWAAARLYGVRWQRVRRDNGAPADTAFTDAVLTPNAATAFADIETAPVFGDFQRGESGVGGHCATLRALCHRTPKKCVGNEKNGCLFIPNRR
jgi:hypothetical protein